VTFYAVPQQIINGFSLLIGGVIPVLFPAFSQLYGLHQDRLESLLRNALKCIVPIMGSATLLLILCARELLFLWMGPALEPSIPVLKLLAPVLVLGTVGWLLTTLLQATGYARTACLVVLLLLVVQAGSITALVPRLGVQGAALGTLGMNTLGVLILLWVVFRSRVVMLSRVVDAPLLYGVVLLVALLGGTYLLKAWLAPGILLGIAIPVLAAGGYLMYAWFRILDPDMRGYVSKVAHTLVTFRRGPPAATAP
jgi:O-antigen/teichoic acid export membrane protein